MVDAIAHGLVGRGRQHRRGHERRVFGVGARELRDLAVGLSGCVGRRRHVLELRGQVVKIGRRHDGLAVGAAQRDHAIAVRGWEIAECETTAKDVGDGRGVERLHLGPRAGRRRDRSVLGHVRRDLELRKVVGDGRPAVDPFVIVQAVQVDVDRVVAAREVRRQ